MRILVLVGSDIAAQREARFNSSRDVVFRSRPSVVARKGEAEVHYIVMCNDRDADRLRGCRFDLIIEDASFNPGRSHERGRLMDLVRATVLR